MFHFLPFFSKTSERNYQDGSLCYLYFTLGWGYWGIDLVIKEEEFQDDKDFFEYD